ncbi:MAG: tRNA dihydrouridine synthase DusB [Ruminococcaceae bacterium]|nr:tRNA dihydrouridine synthase DusB [Oscillospiraceae bacterium]
MQLGNLKIEGFAGLAPMAGVADRAFRQLCREYGAAYTVSEMVSSKGLTMGDRKSKELMKLTDVERPCGVQIFGADPVIMAGSVKAVSETNPDFIDINMGCPAPKIAGNGGGASLMRDIPKAGDIIRAVTMASSVPVTVKMRSGWDSESINALSLSKAAEKFGAAAVTVHGRTRAQMYAPPVNTDIIAEIKKSISIPVIANGDITDGQSAALMREKTNCDFLLVGRGALGRPWVFSQINAYLSDGRIIPEPPVSERMRVMVKHIKLICEYKGDRVGIREARKHAAWYMKGIRGGAEFRRRAGTLESIEQLEEIAFEICKENE